MTSPTANSQATRGICDWIADGLVIFSGIAVVCGAVASRHGLLATTRADWPTIVLSCTWPVLACAAALVAVLLRRRVRNWLDYAILVLTWVLGGYWLYSTIALFVRYHQYM